ncbi:D-arabinono-1,4-lactone oxidase [Streptomyces sp. NPDC057743]|uniref:D-arabinono-1,4-lactone oxidase n=1 Tax=Streptomyces sp. NPDC057743 TaxID=3346236 RepID=UPI0036AEC33D
MSATPPRTVTNWSGNVAFGAREFVAPTSVPELQAVVARGRQVRALGTAHSFNDLADTPGTLLSVTSLPPVVEVDSRAATVKVAAGLPYSDVVGPVERAGFALPNLASLPHVSVGGSVVTGTHGSGVRNGCLSTSVAALDLVTADGDLVTLARDTHPREFEGAVVNLGALGVVTSVTLDLVPTFAMRQRVYEGLPLEVLDAHFAELVADAYSVCLFTDWRGPRLTQVWINQRIGDPDPTVVHEPWFTAVPADGPRHPVDGLDADCCTQQLGVIGPWHERLSHFRPDAVPSAGDELQSEYLLAAQDAPAALRALDLVRERLAPVLHICEVRTVAADRLWLSPAQGRDSVSIHFTWTSDLDAVLPVVRLVEDVLTPFAARPHWAKVYTTAPDVVRSHYPKLPDFVDLVHGYDPHGKFTNEHLRRCIDADRSTHC